MNFTKFIKTLKRFAAPAILTAVIAIVGLSFSTSARLVVGPKTLFSAQATTGVSPAIKVQGYRNIVVSFATDGGSDAALTTKFQCAISDTAPDFSAAQSVTNMWDYVQVVDLEDGSTIDGDTGIVVATADDYRLVEANVNGCKWFSSRVTARTQGEVTVKIMQFDNQ